ncbi:MAG: adenylyl-sulfate kinase [Bacteroidales bacterium]|nr:adenylyl-sulfate kinase [Bacteroidales bacterium]
MEKIRQNIYPVFGKLRKRETKEKILGQKSRVIWFSGLSGAGKTTLAKNLEDKLSGMNFIVQVLDGDNIRSGINNNLTFSEEDRKENIRRISEVSKLFLDCGIITINSFISPTREIRHMAMDIIGREDFIEVFVNAPLEICEKRDVKGLYARARKGEIKDFTGISAPFEEPVNADIEIHTDLITIDESIEKLLEFILPKIKLSI